MPAPIATLADAASLARVWHFAGKLHPLVVHFPIALLIVAAILEMFRRAGDRRPLPTARICLWLGALAALVAAMLGWSDAETAGHPEAAISLHRWLGVNTAMVAMISLGCAIASQRRPGRRVFLAYRLSVLLAAGLVGAAGHFGGLLVYGTGYIDAALALLHPSPASAPAATVADHNAAIDFVRDVRPILARRCLSCHSGNDPASGLNLDDHASVLKGGKSSQPALVAGKAADSRLIQLVTGHDKKLVMPPKGGPLDAEQIAMLRRWIDAGALWVDSHAPGEHWHWAYRPPRRANPPPVKDTYWPRNPVDQFVLARLESDDLRPSPEADRATLMRRASLDLFGLPPTIEELDEFLADKQADAYERMIDRLLASPYHGERWARVWLDQARYADTNGYEKDERRTMWPYRDWVIDALNRDLPFDRFTVEQLAGDLLPSPTPDQLIATGFNRNSMINAEGGVDPEEFRVEAIIDRVNTVSSVWLGSTVACAQCHDHKFDPISQQEYYQLFAFFNQDELDGTPSKYDIAAGGPQVEVTRPGQRAELDRVREQIAELERELKDRSEHTEAEQQQWEARARTQEPEWIRLVPTRVTSPGGTIFRIKRDGTVVVSGPEPEKDVYTVELSVEQSNITGLRLDVLPEKTTPIGGVGRSPHGNIVLSRFAVERPSDNPADQATTSVPILRAAADFEQSGDIGAGGHWAIAHAIDEDPKTGGWALEGQNKLPHTAVFELAQPTGDGPTKLTITMEQNYGGKHTIARFRLSATTAPRPVDAAPLSTAVRDILDVAADQRTTEQRKTLAEFYRSISPTLAPLRRDLAALHKRDDELIIARTMVMRRAANPRDTFVHIRGNFLNKGDRVEPATPKMLPPLPADAPRDRLALARWLVDGRNPLVARVAINRIWQHYFGRGLVESSEDFGTQGDPPTHPDLLDWLATEFIRQGWSMKAMHRLIATSATYRQSSSAPPQLREKDPDNRWLARGPRFRVEAEMVRDVALASSGLLCRRIGGPSVFPPQPPGIWTMIYSTDQWVESTGENRHRRGLYTFWRRTAPYPTFAGLDAPSRELACTRRPRTNTPLQALTTLNDPAFVEAAAGLARRLVSAQQNDLVGVAANVGKRAQPKGAGWHGQVRLPVGTQVLPETMAKPDVAAKIALGFRLCVSRNPTAAESERLRKLFEDQLHAFREDPAAAKLLTHETGDGAVELAAWQVLASVLLNLDETITKG